MICKIYKQKEVFLFSGHESSEISSKPHLNFLCKQNLLLRGQQTISLFCVEIKLDLILRIRLFEIPI